MLPQVQAVVKACSSHVQAKALDYACLLLPAGHCSWLLPPQMARSASAHAAAAAMAALQMAPAAAGLSAEVFRLAAV